MNKETMFRILRDKFHAVPIEGDRVLFREKLPEADIDKNPKDEEIVLFTPELCYPGEPVETHYPSWFPREPQINGIPQSQYERGKEGPEWC